MFNILNGIVSVNSDGTDTIVKFIDSMELGAVKNVVVVVVRALGFGPEADGIATVIAGAIGALIVIGYATGTSNTTGTGPADTSSTSSAANTTQPTDNKSGTDKLNSTSDDKKKP